MFEQLILRSNGPIGEQILVGGLTGLIFVVVLYIYNRSKEKKQAKEAIRHVQRDMVTTLTSIGPDAIIVLSSYNTLFDELKEKCNPANFMAPYDAKCVEISNAIYAQLSGNKHNLSVLISLRNQAIRDLGIQFSTQELFDKLTEIYNPNKFVGDNYSSERLHVANKIYSQIQSKRNDIIGLEQIARECGIILMDGHKGTSIATSQNIAASSLDINKAITITIIVFFVIVGLIYMLVHMANL